MNILSTNPAKGYENIGQVNSTTREELEEIVISANIAKRSWRKLGAKKRTKILEEVYKELSNNSKEIAELITREIGKPIRESIADIEWDLEYFRWFLDNGKKHLADKVHSENENTRHIVSYEPIGTAAVITPWNFPFSMFVWGVVPNLIAGNTVIHKPSELCPLTSKYIEDIIKNCNLPEGVFAVVYGDGEMGNALVNQDIDLIWFTGSTEVGLSLYELSGKKFIKSVLELGGSNPAIVFGDVDINEVLENVYRGRFLNCGQTCDAIKRLIVHESIFDEFCQKFVELVKTKIVGDPEREDTDIGSLASKDQLSIIEKQVKDAIDNGAKVLVGADKPKSLDGAYYLPTILTDVTKDMKVWNEEVFGPVIPIVPFSTESEAIELANDTEYGLGAKVYSKDKYRAIRVAKNIQAGNVEINNASHWLPSNPFGGVKKSGVGREHGKEGFYELCEIKVLSIPR